MFPIRLIFPALLSLLMAACAVVPVGGPIEKAIRPDLTQVTGYAFSGRISVKQADQGHYGNIRWLKRGAENDITLLSPLGQIVAQIRSQPNAVTLTLDNKREYRAEDGESLTQQVLGYTVPVSGLPFWLLGYATPDSDAETTSRPDGLFDTIKQQGWRIQYQEYMTVDGVQLPRRVVLDRGNLEIRLVIDQWNLSK